jgi:anti-sigma factor ChrR (cupin superfamily)
MTDCQKIAALLDDFVDGALNTADRQAVDEHVASCPDCRSELEAIQAVVHAARDLPTEVTPERDLWPAIAERLDTPAPARRPVRQWLAAAAVIVAVVGAWWMGRWSATQQAPANSGVVHVAAEATPDYRDDYRRARADLHALLDSRRQRMSAENLRIVEQNVALIDRAIEDIEAALLDNPEDPNLNRSLRLAYARQLDVLETATRWTLQS